MPLLTDPEKLTCYKNALANWRYDGFMTFTKDAMRWLHQKMPSWSTREIAKLLYEYVAAGGEIDQQPETRDYWKTLHDYHYDVRVLIAGQLIYFETRLSYRDPSDPDDPLIDVVNIHEA
jgi:hypothetical protein